jgi:hypothetical protein
VVYKIFVIFDRLSYIVVVFFMIFSAYIVRTIVQYNNKTIINKASDELLLYFFITVAYYIRTLRSVEISY